MCGTHIGNQKISNTGENSRSCGCCRDIHLPTLGAKHLGNAVARWVQGSHVSWCLFFQWVCRHEKGVGRLPDTALAATFFVDRLSCLLWKPMFVFRGYRWRPRKFAIVRRVQCRQSGFVCWEERPHGQCGETSSNMQICCFRRNHIREI
jgi:hypothetical protein